MLYRTKYFTFNASKAVWVSFWLSTLYVTYQYASNTNMPIDYSTKLTEDVVLIPKDYSPDNLNEKETTFNKDSPLIFIGGMPRSGTTLMRTMLDAHPDVRCGQETRLIPKILSVREDWMNTLGESIRLEAAGVSRDVLNDAMVQFILEVIVKHGKPANRLCNKDPFTLEHASYLNEIFPNAKFILMLRDGRASAHSIISRHVIIFGFDITSYRDVLAKWNYRIEKMYKQCIDVGPLMCMPVKYENLVLQPVKTLHKILAFLDLPWTEDVLNHEKHMTNISLSNVESSTTQVQKPIYLDALTSWFGKIPEDVCRDLPIIAPMLSTLGYNPFDRTPKYGNPDAWVLNKTQQATKGKEQSHFI